MKIFYSIEDFLQSRLHVKSFIPTMGNLHEGHLSLVRKAKDLSSNTCVSIYVNKAQFDKEDDLLSLALNSIKKLEKLTSINKKISNEIETNFEKEMKSLRYL